MAECIHLIDPASACGTCSPPAPARGDDIEAWITRKRDEHSRTGLAWMAVDDLLESYRLHADTGTPLSEEVMRLG